MRRRRSSCAPTHRQHHLLALLALALVAAGLATALGQAPAAPSPATNQNQDQCGVIAVTGKKCYFRATAGNQARLTIQSPVVRTISSEDHSVVALGGSSGNPLRSHLNAIFLANPAKPTTYLDSPMARVTVNGGTAGTSRLVASREASVRRSGGKYQVFFQRGAGLDDLTPSGGFPSGSKCDLVVWTPCPSAAPPAGGCEREGEVDFKDGAGCVPVCPPGEVDVGDGCAPPAAEACEAGTCITSFEGTFVDSAGTCVTACPEGTVASGEVCVPVPGPCSYADTKCAVGATCPGGTAVSAECADRSAFKENPCACTALQQLAALSDTLQNMAPWNDLVNKATCQIGSTLQVQCASIGGVQLPAGVNGNGAGLAGALPPSLGELGPSLKHFLDLRANAITSLPSEIGILTGLTYLQLSSNGLTSVPTELAALTGLKVLDLSNNQLTGVPAEFRTVNPSDSCFVDNPGFSCANVGAGTSCCTARNCGGDTSTCYTG